MDDRMLHHPCSALLPGHRHCRHGHTEDCPDPGNCELLPEPDARHKALVEDSIRKIKETMPDLMERLRVAHVCEDPDNCAFGNEGCYSPEQLRKTLDDDKE